MSNTIYLVCVHHPQRIQSFRLGSRGTRTGYTTSSRIGVKLDEWLETHRNCGGGLDHFALALDLPSDHDLPKIDEAASSIHDIATTRLD